MAKRAFDNEIGSSDRLVHVTVLLQVLLFVWEGRDERERERMKYCRISGDKRSRN
jgi:hypothetical protein